MYRKTERYGTVESRVYHVLNKDHTPSIEYLHSSMIIRQQPHSRSTDRQMSIRASYVYQELSSNVSTSINDRLNKTGLLADH